MKRERQADGKWPLTPALADAQHRLMALTGQRISQAEVQRLQLRLEGDWHAGEVMIWAEDDVGFYTTGCDFSREAAIIGPRIMPPNL